MAHTLYNLIRASDDVTDFIRLIWFTQ